MKKIRSFTLALAALVMLSCKKDPAPVAADPAPAATEQEAPAAPAVEIAADDELTANVKDAVKDFPGVNTAVTDGEIVLTGEITRERLPMLMQSLHALHPKKITNNLNITK